VLVAGTNGKGSVTAMVERGLRAAGWRTGRYTSPHLTMVEERFAVDGQTVAPDVLDDALERVRRAASALDHPPSFFEATTAAALEIFAQAGVELAVLEVGLGGRLDATNVVDPIGAAITTVDFDHTAQLGSRLEDIAHEKAGIVRPAIPVVLAPNAEAVRAVVAERCLAAGARFIDAARDCRSDAVMEQGRLVASFVTPHGGYDHVRLALRGRHQADNARVAVRLLEEVALETGRAIDAAAIRTGLEDAEWPARLELRRWNEQLVLLDAAHNPGGARALAAYLRDTYGRRLPMVIAIMRDKAVDEMLCALAPAASRFIVTAPDSARAETPANLAARARVACPEIPVEVAAAPVDALTRAAAAGEPVVVAGSLYLAGEIRPLLS